MRIAIYHNLQSGGAKRVLNEGVKRLSGNHQFDVYTLSTADMAFSDLRPYVDRHETIDFRPSRELRSPFGRLNPLCRLRDLERLQQVERRIAERIERERYDVALIHPCRFENSPSILRFLDRTPSVFYCHEPLRLLHETMPSRPYERRDSLRGRIANTVDPIPQAFNRYLGGLDHSNLASAKAVLVNSEFTRSSVKRIYGADPSVCYSGVDTELFRPMNTHRGLTDRRPFILSVGSLTPLKAFDFIIRSVALILPSGRPLLKIVSNFENLPERSFIEQLARELDVRMELLGGIADSELAALYNDAQVTVYAPIREPFGLVALEAMACGSPIVAVREGGLLETVIHGTTGLLVERDEQAFAAAIEALLADRHRREEYGRSGRAHVEANWTWEQAAPRLEANLIGTAYLN